MIPPVKKTLTVPAGVDEAFRRFTNEISGWWPLATHSLGADKARACEIEGRVGGRVFEVWTDGTEHMWGTVTVWDPPRRIAFTWHVGRAASSAQEVDVRFTGTDEGTRVDLTHGGWERLDEKARETRANYEAGWDIVLDHFNRSKAASHDT